MLTTLTQNLPYLLQGAVSTLILSSVVVVGGTVLGLMVGLLSKLSPRPIQYLITGYVFLFRGIPVLVVMFLGFYSFPAMGVRLSATTAVMVSMVVYIGAFITEIVRGAIDAVPAGQTAAAKALGMKRLKIMTEIILPQAVGIAIPPILNIILMAIKQTSYASVVGAWELSFAAREVVERTLAAFEIFGGVMVIYFMICFPISILASRLERRTKVAN